MTIVVGARPSLDERLLPYTGVAVVAPLVAWAWSGRAVAVALAGVGLVSAAAAVVDARDCRIPNRLVLWGLAAVTAGAVVVALGDHRSPGDVAGGALLGVLVSGAPLLALAWLLRPSSIGAGDVKLLAVQGAAIGLLAPLAAVVVLLSGVVVGCGYVLVTGRRTVPLGPGLFIGYVAAVAVGVSANVLFGGVYG